MKTLAWLIEEYDSQGKMLWYGLVMSEPTELSWYKDLKKKLHSVKITPLVAYEKGMRSPEFKKFDLATKKSVKEAFAELKVMVADLPPERYVISVIR